MLVGSREVCDCKGCERVSTALLNKSQGAEDDGMPAAARRCHPSLASKPTQSSPPKCTEGSRHMHAARARAMPVAIFTMSSHCTRARARPRTHAHRHRLTVPYISVTDLLFGRSQWTLTCAPLVPVPSLLMCSPSMACPIRAQVITPGLHHIYSTANLMWRCSKCISCPSLGAGFMR